MGDDADRDTGQRDVTHPVTDQGQPALDQEDPDHRGGQADHQRREERVLHEGVGQDVRHRGLRRTG